MQRLFRSALLSVLAASSVIAKGPVVKLGGSQYKGLEAGSLEHFHNIKFAQDTSGNRRFAPPEPYVPTPGSLVDATTLGPACPQSKPGIPPFFSETPEISEDCLNLRISRPAGTTAKDKLPVVVHLYGGGLIKGSANDPHFDPDNLISLSASLGKPVIFVGLNYRYTIFGFARLPILQEQKALNLGLRDQRAGFQWVKDNIAAFGGDPDRITAFGLSAGGTLTSLHLLSFGGEYGVPFTQAWAMSGPPGTSLNIQSDATEKHTRVVAEKLGCGYDSQSDEEILRCLREIPMDALTEAAMEYSVNNHPPAGTFTFIPSVDGDLIPDRQSVLYRKGNFVKGIPTVFGWTHDDGGTNTGPVTAFQNEEDMKQPIQGLADALTDDDYSQLFSLYAATDFELELKNYEARRQSESDPVVPIHWFRVSRILRDILFTCSAIDFGFEISRQSKSLDPQFTGVRLYELNQSMLTPLFEAFGMPYLGVTHGSDTNYILNGVFPEGKISEADENLSRSMAGAFIHFANTGDPSNPDDEGFRSWAEAFPEVQRLQPNGEPDPPPPPTPREINIHLIGGPLGTGSCHLEADVGSEGLSKMNGADDIQAVLGNLDGGNVRYGEMESTAIKARTHELQREKIFERCAFINSLSEKLGN